MTRVLTFCLAALVILTEHTWANGDSPDGAQEPPRTDSYGDPLPPGVIARMGSGRLRQGDSFFYLFFSPNGKTLVTVSRAAPKGIVRLWDPRTGKLIRRIDLPFQELSYLADARIPPGTNTLIVAVIAEKKCEARAVELTSGKELARREWNLPAEAEAAISPDGKVVAVGVDGTVRLYDRERGQETLRIPLPEGQPFVRLGWSDDGKTLACATNDTICIHDASSGAKIRELKEPGFFVSSVKFAPDGKTLATVAIGNKDAPLTLWNVDTGKVRYREMSRRWFATCFSPDSKHLAIGARRKNLTLLDAATGKVVHSLPAIWTTSLSFSPDGRTLAAGHNHSVSLWNVASGRLLPASASPSFEVRGLRFADDGKRLLGKTDQIISWDAATGKELRRFPSPAMPLPWLLQLSPDETLMAGRRDDDKIGIWDAKTGKEVRTLAAKGWLSPEMFSADSQRLIGYGPDGMRIWDVKSGEVIRQLTDTDEQVPKLLSPDGRWLLSDNLHARGVEPAARLWDVTTGRPAAQFLLPTSDHCVFAFSTDGRRLALAASTFRPTRASFFRILDLPGGTELRSWESARACYALAFAPDGRTLASGAVDYGLRLWEAATGKERHLLKGHEAPIDNAVFAPDGRRLAASSTDAPVFVWDIWAGLPARKKLGAKDLERCWADLAGEDAAAAFAAIRLLSTAPAEAVPFVRERLRAAARPDEKRVAELVKELESPTYAVRQKAAAELERMGDGVAAHLRKALGKAESVEQHRRLDALVRRVEALTPEALRGVRAVEALEWTATAAAEQLLDDLAKGAAGARLTAEAQGARSRLRRSQPRP